LLLKIGIILLTLIGVCKIIYHELF